MRRYRVMLMAVRAGAWSVLHFRRARRGWRGSRSSHFLRVFSKATGQTPHAYLVNLRVNLARELLATGTRPAEAAVAAGFSDQSHLTRVFKRIVGVTPGHYARAVTARADGTAGARKHRASARAPKARIDRHSGAATRQHLRHPKESSSWRTCIHRTATRSRPSDRGAGRRAATLPTSPPRRPISPGAPSGLLALWYRRWADRCELAWLAEHYPDELLDDVGVAREDLVREARKPFWRR